ncbi:MAG: hypothetical protein IPG46_03680 [Actinobacteria bacterium]|nr:hypothetical protein [Actinomycetota bacterium]
MIDATQASETRLRQFVADAAHELRTPLTTLQGYSALHARDAHLAGTPLGDSLRRIHSEAERMTRIVDDLQLLANLDEQRNWYGPRLTWARSFGTRRPISRSSCQTDR